MGDGEGMEIIGRSKGGDGDDRWEMGRGWR